MYLKNVSSTCKSDSPSPLLPHRVLSVVALIRAQGIGGSLRRAGTTLTRLKAADLMDTIVMGASTLFFFGTVCFVLYQRIPLLGLL